MSDILAGLMVTEYILESADIQGDEDFIDVRLQYCGKSDVYPQGSWAIRELGSCLNKAGEWVYEPMPSNRTKKFLRSCRFSTAEEAVKFWRSKKCRSRRWAQVERAQGTGGKA